MTRTLDDQIAAYRRHASSTASALALEAAVGRLRDAGVSDADIAEDAEVAAMLARLQSATSIPL